MAIPAAVVEVAKKSAEIIKKGAEVAKQAAQKAKTIAKSKKLDKKLKKSLNKKAKRYAKEKLTEKEKHNGDNPDEPSKKVFSLSAFLFANTYIMFGGFLAIIGVTILMIYLALAALGIIPVFDFAQEDDVRVGTFGGYEIRYWEDDLTMTEKIILLLEQYPEAFEEIDEYIDVDLDTFLRILRAESRSKYVRTGYEVAGNVYLVSDIDTLGNKAPNYRCNHIPVFLKSDKAKIPWQLIYAVVVTGYEQQMFSTPPPYSASSSQVLKIVQDLQMSFMAKDMYHEDYYTYDELKILEHRVEMQFYADLVYRYDEEYKLVEVTNRKVQTYCPVTLAGGITYYGGNYTYTYNDDGDKTDEKYHSNYAVLKKVFKSINGKFDDVTRQSLVRISASMPYGGKDVAEELAQNFNIDVPETEDILFWDEEYVEPEDDIEYGEWTYPVPKDTPVTSDFGPRDTGIAGASKWHKAIDLAGWSPSVNASVTTGFEIRCYMDGVVARKGYQSKGAGNFVYIDHANGFTSFYFHMDTLSPLQVGQEVHTGDVVGVVGNTGVGSGAHLHFGLYNRIDGKYYNPAYFVEEDAWIGGRNKIYTD